MNDFQEYYQDFSCEYSFTLPPMYSIPRLDFPQISDTGIPRSNPATSLGYGFYQNYNGGYPGMPHINYNSTETIIPPYQVNENDNNSSDIGKENDIPKELLNNGRNSVRQPEPVNLNFINNVDVNFKNFKNVESGKFFCSQTVSGPNYKNTFRSNKTRVLNSFKPTSVPCPELETHSRSGPCELLISNLDYNISPREWKEILHSTFRNAVAVVDVTVKTQPDNSNLAILRVPTMEDAKFAISQFNGKKIGYKRVHVCLKSEESLNNQSNMKAEVIAILKESKGYVLPLFKFIEQFDRRHHRSITLSELYKLKGIVEIREQGGAGRMVHLTSAFISSQKTDDEVQECLESSFCSIHCSGKMSEIVETLSNNFLPNVKIRRSKLSSDTKVLLEKHGGSIPLMSFPVCYSMEIHPLEIFNNDGVNLEHLISTIGGVKIISGKTGVKKVQYSEKSNITPSQLSSSNDTGDYLSVPASNCSLSQQLCQISREVVELLKNSPNCQIAFSKFIPEYHHHFGRQCRVSDYGYTKLVELLEAIPHVLQILGNGDKRTLTLSHKAQMRRFTSEVLKILKLQNNKEMRLSEFPSAYERILEKPWNITDYGVCYIEDLFSDVSATTFLVSEDVDPVLSVPKKNQSAAEIARTKQFSREVVDIIRHNPYCEMTFNKFIPSYHHHFGRQCKVADYGVVKLLELFECIPQVVQIEEREERMLVLSKPEKLRIFADQITSLLRSNPDQRMSLIEVETTYNCLFECPFDLETQTQQQLVALLKPLFQVDVQDGQTYLSIKPNPTECPPLAKQIIFILTQYGQDTFSLPLKAVSCYYQDIYHAILDSTLLPDLIYYVQVIGEKELAVVTLSPLQEFSRLLLPILHHQNPLPLSELESSFHNMYGIEVKPALYSCSSVKHIINSIRNVVDLKKTDKGFYLSLNEDFKGQL
ncbi:meiosis regulator and mRNA stability factor 1-like, partial [Argonauta hians]